MEFLDKILFNRLGTTPINLCNLPFLEINAYIYGKKGANHEHEPYEH